MVGTFPIPMAAIAQPPAQMPGDRGARALMSIWLTLERKTRSIDRYPVGKPARGAHEIASAISVCFAKSLMLFQRPLMAI